MTCQCEVCETLIRSSATVADGLEPALMGFVMRFGMSEPVAVYDVNAVIRGFTEAGCSDSEAWERFEFNVIGAWAGDRTPFFLWQCAGYR